MKKVEKPISDKYDFTFSKALSGEELIDIINKFKPEVNMIPIVTKTTNNPEIEKIGSGDKLLGFTNFQRHKDIMLYTMKGYSRENTFSAEDTYTNISLQKMYWEIPYSNKVNEKGERVRLADLTPKQEEKYLKRVKRIGRKLNTAIKSYISVEEEQ